MKNISKPYNPQRAWLRALIYFGVCFTISWQTGVLEMLLHTPLITAQNLQQPQWIAFTAVCWAIIALGYGYIWPKGTLTHGRKLYLGAVLSFGLLWGLSEAQLFVSIWAIVSQFTRSEVGVIIVSFIIISAFNGLWHAFYWDIYVAPEHNIAEWNMKKVLFAHIPNLAVTLSYLTLFKSAGMFVLMQTLALLLSTLFMHFPPFWRAE